MPSKLIIDADPGIGDALAVAIALLDPEVDLLAVTATAGCVSGATASRNLQTVIELIDPDKWPRLGSSDAELPLPGGGLIRATLIPRFSTDARDWETNSSRSPNYTSRMNPSSC